MHAFQILLVSTFTQRCFYCRISLSRRRNLCVSCTMLKWRSGSECVMLIESLRERITSKCLCTPWFQGQTEVTSEIHLKQLTKHFAFSVLVFRINSDWTHIHNIKNVDPSFLLFFFFGTMIHCNIQVAGIVGSVLPSACSVKWKCCSILHCVWLPSWKAV